MYNKDSKQLMVILGRKWQDTNGNTYHTAEVISRGINFKTEKTYGYGNQFIWTAREILEKDYNVNMDNYIVIDRVIQVERRRDL